MGDVSWRYTCTSLRGALPLSSPSSYIILVHPGLGQNESPRNCRAMDTQNRMVWMQEGGSGPCIAIGSFPRPGAKHPWKRRSCDVALIFLLKSLLLPSQVPGSLAWEFFHARRISRRIFSHFFECLHIG